MKRILLYIVILAALWLVPVRGTELGKMIPVETIYIYKEEDQIILQTDTGNYGTGKTIQQTIHNLHEGAAGYLFLDTAKYLLMTEDTIEYIEDIQEYLKPDIYLCMAEGEIDIEKAAMHLSVHIPSAKLKNAYHGAKTEKMYAVGEQMYLE